jgi:hypothetical protein
LIRTGCLCFRLEGVLYLEAGLEEEHHGSVVASSSCSGEVGRGFVVGPSSCSEEVGPSSCSEEVDRGSMVGPSFVEGVLSTKSNLELGSLTCACLAAKAAYLMSSESPLSSLDAAVSLLKGEFSIRYHLLRISCQNFN